MTKIGILGAGQLGKMLVEAASRLGLKTHIFAPDSDPIAAKLADFYTKADYNDIEALRKFARQVDVITLEFENIPVSALDSITTPIYPSPEILKISQHRLREKQQANALGIATASFAAVSNQNNLQEAANIIGIPGILKTCMFGYDGKGQWAIRDKNDLAAINFPDGDYIYEAFVNFRQEISVIIVRSISGEMQCFEATENIHKNHILHKSSVPAVITEEIADKARDIAITLAESLNLVGILAVEMFVTNSGEVLLNEIAPRPHNSGHWTMDGCNVSQFEQAIRAVCGMNLIKPERKANKVTMINLIGDDVLDLSRWQSENSYIHIYGKKEIRNGRKMGHVNIVEE